MIVPTPIHILFLIPFPLELIPSNMASKSGMAGGIPERRVRPIWDAIDSSQFKNALKLLQTLRAKYPKSPYALGLQALVLERMGKFEEALSVCLSAKEQLYTCESILYDDLTLSTLQIVFQRLNRLDLATSCYEYACGKLPNNLELMIGLFNCYVREYSFVKQQQIAIKMYKIAGEESFLLWAVCSVQLQVFFGDEGGKLLPLAEGLLKKHIALHSLREPEALLVYISVLEQQAKFGDALEILTGTLGSLVMMKVDRLRMQGRLLAQSGDYDAAAHVFQKNLELCPDDWECFRNYLCCLLEDESNFCNAAMGDHMHSSKYTSCKSSHLTEDVFDSRLALASAFVQKLQTKSSNDFLRCPYLAILEIERQKHLYGKGDDAKLMEALMQYFLRFGYMACFAKDVEIFLQIITVDKKTEFLESLTKVHCCLPMVTITSLGKLVTVFKLQELTGSFFRLSVSHLVNVAANMVEMYCKSLPLSKDLDEQECMHGEELLSLACNVLIQLYWRTRQLGYLLEAIMILEFGLTLRTYTWQYKILLMHLYSHLGVFSISYEWYKSLDAKNILLETVLHQIMPQMLVSPLWVDLNDILTSYLKFMDDHFRESADLTFLAYRHRNYSKAIEFVQFKEHLQHSNQYLMARVEAPILQLKQSADNLEETESILGSLKYGIHFLELSNEIETKSLTFNEDLQCRPWWTPTPDRNHLLEPFEGVAHRPMEDLQHTKMWEANVRNTIGRRSLLPRLIYISIQCASSSLHGTAETNDSGCDPKMFSELKNLLERYASFLGFPLYDAIEVVVGASSGQKSLEVLNPNMTDWLNFTVFFNAWNLRSHGWPEKEKHKPDGWKMVDSLLQKCVMEIIRSMRPLSSSAGVKLPILVQLITEPLAWHSLIIQSCICSSVPSRKKKKKAWTVNQFSSPLFSGIRASIQSQCGLLEEVLNWLREHILRPEEEATDTLLSSFQREEDECPWKVLPVLEVAISTMAESELGARLFQVAGSWSRVDVLRKMVTEQCKVLSEFLHICERKLKSLQALKQQIFP